MMTQSRTDWFCRAQWGLFFHYLAAPASSSGGRDVTAEDWDQRIAAFDVERLAHLAASVGAGYVGLTLGQNSGHFCSPNAAYDRITGIKPSKLSRRDLLADLAIALRKRNIRTMAYLPSGAPEFEPAAVEKFKWKPFGGRMPEFQRMWEAVISEWGERWGDLVDAWWIDGVYDMDRMYRQPDEPNIVSFAAALRAGNPNRIIAWNPGVKLPVVVHDPHEDYTAGETNLPQLIDCPGRFLEGRQFHILSFLGSYWGTGQPRFSDEQAAEYTQYITRQGGVVTWDVPIRQDSSIDASFVRQLTALGDAMKKDRHTRGDRLDFPPAPRRAFIVPSIRRPMMAAEPTPVAAEVRLKCRNLWPEEITERITFFVEPSGSAKVSPAVTDLLRIPARGDVTVNVTVEPAPQAALQPLTLRYQRQNDSRVSSVVVPVCQSIDIATLASDSTHDSTLAELPGALAQQPEFVAHADGVQLASIRIALTPARDQLAVVAKVVDLKMTQTSRMWDGSCIEVFGTSVDAAKVHQLFVAPATATDAARAGRLVQKSDEGYVVQTEPAIALHSTPTSNGYVLAAKIPLALLGVTDPAKFRLEFSITGATASDQFQRATIFGSTDAARDVSSYAVVNASR